VTDDLGRDGTKFPLKQRFGDAKSLQEYNIALALSEVCTVRKAALKNVGIAYQKVESKYLYEYAVPDAEDENFQTPPPSSKKRKVIK
jgi:hypothetical protein